MMIRALIAIVIALLPGMAFSQGIDPAKLKQLIKPAPDGDPLQVAQKAIDYNFGEMFPGICPVVIDAKRLGDGSIMAICSKTSETFRVFDLITPDGRTTMAMRCKMTGC